MKARLFLLLLLLFGSGRAAAQDTLRVSLPEVVTISRSPDKYTWQKVASLDHHTIIVNSIAVTGSAVYCFGGFNTNVALRKMYRLEGGNLVTDSLQYPGKGFFDNIFFIRDSVLYIGGGKDSSKSAYCYNDFWMYSLKTRQWKQANDLPFYYLNSPSLTARGDQQLALISRLQGKDFLETVPVLYEYNFEADRWEVQSQAPPEPGLLLPVSFMAGDDLYILFQAKGSFGNGYNNAFYKLSPESGIWTSLPPFPGKLRSFLFALSDERYGYIGGGAGDGLSNRRAVYRYDPGKALWEEITPLPVGVRHAKGWRYQGESYVGFGISDKRDQVTIWKLTHRK